MFLVTTRPESVQLSVNGHFLHARDVDVLGRPIFCRCELGVSTFGGLCHLCKGSTACPIVYVHVPQDIGFRQCFPDFLANYFILLIVRVQGDVVLCRVQHRRWCRWRDANGTQSRSMPSSSTSCKRSLTAKLPSTVTAVTSPSPSCHKYSTPPPGKMWRALGCADIE